MDLERLLVGVIIVHTITDVLIINIHFIYLFELFNGFFRFVHFIINLTKVVSEIFALFIEDLLFFDRRLNGADGEIEDTSLQEASPQIM